MSIRMKKTLLSLAYCIPGVMGIALFGHLGTISIAVWTVIWAATVGYAWWWYGDSEKAVALRTKAEAKKAQRRGEST
ncbi:hypothetical protein [Kitasatospora sp. GAS204B]|uniref:hypothetical protein n=1 Tax=unclassified Kitasatospora TaxID=2633591 RepID=UPI0024730C34|nr:hypothetical protein [Kitasatospora sp. GAS204B]MDH6122911.1 hypothetical protein [Kitasatospora sp. GAS204B]